MNDETFTSLEREAKEELRPLLLSSFYGFPALCNLRHSALPFLISGNEHNLFFIFC